MLDQQIEEFAAKDPRALSSRIPADFSLRLCLVLAGKQATVYTRQQYVRTLPDRKDGSPHEVITGVKHRETWVYTNDGWASKRIEELEQGQTYLDGEPYDPR